MSGARPSAPSGDEAAPDPGPPRGVRGPLADGDAAPPDPRPALRDPEPALRDPEPALRDAREPPPDPRRALLDLQRAFVERALTTRPWLTWTAIVALALVHAAIVLMTARPDQSGFSWWEAAIGAVPSSALVQLGAVGPDTLARGELWRFALAALLHGSGVHLIVNALALHNLGREVERLLGRGALLASLSVGALLGSYASARFENAWAVGASGAVLALAGTLVTGVRGPLIRREAVWGLRRQIGFMTILLMGLGIAWNKSYGPSTGTLIGNAAHAGGFVGGFALGLVLPAAGVAATGIRRALRPIAVTGPVLLAAALTAEGALAVARAREAALGRRARAPSAEQRRLLERLERELTALRSLFSTGGPLRAVEVELPALGLAIDLGVPERWVELDADDAGCVFGPAPGSPLLQLRGMPAAAPGNTPDEVVDGIERDFASIAVAPFERVEVDGHRAVRLEMEYRPSASAPTTHQVRYIVRRGPVALHVIFLGPPPLAGEAAERIVPTLRLRGAPGR